MGKSCIRFKKLEDVPLDVVAAELRRYDAKKWISLYERALGSRGKPVSEKKVVKIAFIAPFTGGNAQQGISGRNGFELAIKEANASGS